MPEMQQNCFDSPLLHFRRENSPVMLRRDLDNLVLRLGLD
jgi:hypothetical protein